MVGQHQLVARGGLRAALLIGVQILTQMWPFTVRFTEYVESVPPSLPEPPEMPNLPELPDAEEPAEAEEPEAPASDAAKHFEIKIGKDGVRIGPKGAGKEAAQVDISPEGLRIVTPPEPGASGAASTPGTVLDIRLPKEAAEEIRREMEQARREAVVQARDAVKAEHARELQRWEREYQRVLSDWKRAARNSGKQTRVIRYGEFLEDLSILWVLFSLIVKATYKGRQEAEAKAAAAEESAEAEALKRQLVEARLTPCRPRWSRTSCSTPWRPSTT